MNYNNLLFFNKLGHQTNLIWNGNFWEARMMLPQVSIDLFETEHLFIIERFKNISGDIVYGYPHITPDITSDVSASGIYGSFISGSKVIATNIDPLPEYIGAKLFCSQFPNGSIITAVDIPNKKITISDNATATQSSLPLLFNLWRTSFETTRNVIDFDQFSNIKADIVKGKDYITIKGDLSGIKDSEYKLIILGDGIPKDARIVKIVGNNIYLNKTLSVTLLQSDIFVYPIEEKNDVSDYIYQFDLTEDVTLDSPVLNVLDKAYYKIDYDSTETIVSGQRITDAIESSSVSINITLNSPEEGVFGRTFVIEDLSLGYPKTIARIEIHGETIGEDERYKILLNNFGRKLNSDDAYILRDSDPSEPYPDYDILNTKRKELLLEGHEIFPYMGSYKGLINAVKFFGYYDLRIKEYWLNIKKSKKIKTSLQENQEVIDSLKSQTGNQVKVIKSILDDENSNKYKQVEVYGKKDDGTYGIKSSLEQIFPSSSFKKTSLFGLYYDINRIVEDEYDEFGYPVIENAFAFSPEEVLIKLFGLKEKLKKDYLPLNARIIDITGEGVYFELYKTRGWIDSLKIDELNQGIDVEISATPSFGYVEDLRHFGLRDNNTIPYVPYVGPDLYNYHYTTYGNITLPTVANAELRPNQSLKLATAIDNFYEERNHGGVPKYFLGDGDSKMGGYIKMMDGKKYEVPAGFPTVLEVTSFDLSWDEIQNQWESLDRNVSEYYTTLASTSDITGYVGDNLISTSLTYSFDLTTVYGTIFSLTLPTGISYLNPSTGKLQLKFTSNSNSSYKFLVELQSYNSGTGLASVQLLWATDGPILNDWKIELTNLFSDNLSFYYYDYSFNPDGYYSWDNLRFAGFYEIEWTVIKEGEGTPFKYQFRDRLNKYYRVPMFLPYSGIYSVRCRVWNGFNDICTAFFKDLIEVKPREIEITNVARYREAEIYTWENTRKPWDDYPSSWIFPVEKSEQVIKTTNQILDPAEYGNQFNEGQECKVLKTIGETVASSIIDFGVQKISLSGFTSTYPGGGRGPVAVTIDNAYLPHSFHNDERVTILDNYNTGASNLSGTYIISNVTSTGFKLPFTISNIVNPALITVIKTGTIQIKYKGREYVNTTFSNRLDTTLGNLMFKINNANKDPKFGVDTIETSNVTSANVQEWLKMSFKAPIGSGSSFNNQNLEIITTGGIYVYDGSSPVQYYNSPITGGVNPYNEYVDFSFGGDIPVENIRFYGTKGLNWDAFDMLEWDNVYSQTWGMYDYHNDWLGGFSIYNISTRDLIKVGRQTKGIVLDGLGLILDSTISPDLSPGYLDLKEACYQLNRSKDPGISKFTYTVRGFSKLPLNFDEGGNPIGTPIATLAIPYNEETELIDLQTDTSPGTEAPTSITQDPHGNIIMGGKYFVKLFNSKNNIDSYPISGDYPGSIPRKVYNDEYNNWWCYGERCAVPLVIYNRQFPEKTRILTSSPVTGFNSDLNLIVPIKDSEFQVLSLAVDGMTDNFVIYIKYTQSYTIGTIDDVFALLEFNASTREFNFLSTNGPVWDVSKNYAIGDVCEYLGHSYVSNIANNLGNQPSYIYGWDLVDSNVLKYLNIGYLSIRQMKYKYVGKRSSLWIATDGGVKIYDGVKFQTINVDNSGLTSDDVYSICFDEAGGKWIGTADAIHYFDGERWGCWNIFTNTEFPAGKYRNIVNIGNGRIFFIVQLGDDNYQLIYFNGVSSNVYITDPGALDNFSPITYFDYDYEDLYFSDNKIKTINENFTKYPGDLIYLSEPYRTGQIYSPVASSGNSYSGVYNQPVDTYLKKIYYLIPFIHAEAKYPGASGWDFIYYKTFNPVGDISLLNNNGIGSNAINFNLIVGPLSSFISVGKSPQLPFVDTKTWRKPTWIDYDFDKVTDSHPEIDHNDLFLDAPLRDIIDGRASKESYWKNSSLTRSSDRSTGEFIKDYEWLLRIGTKKDEKGVGIFVGEDDFIYVTGYFSGAIDLGPKNDLSSGGHVYLNSTRCQSAFAAKYNKFGVIQWAKVLGEDLFNNNSFDYDYFPASIKVDSLGNVIVVGRREKNRNNINPNSELPSSFYFKLNWDSEIEVKSILLTTSSVSDTYEIKEVEVDRVGNTYLIGTFTGELNGGNFTINSTTQSIFVVRIEIDGNVRWLYKKDTGYNQYNPSLKLSDSYNDLYVSFSSIETTDQKIYFSKYSSYDLIPVWEKVFLNKDNGIPVVSPAISNPDYIAESHISTSKKGELVLAMSFYGSISVDDITINSLNYDSNIMGSGSTDIALFKFNGSRILWSRVAGSSMVDRVHSVDIDLSGNVYLLGSYEGYFKSSPEYTSPNYYKSPQGDSDVLLLKYEKGGTLIDIVSSGGINKDEGMSISLDSDDNAYITGYVTGSAKFFNWKNVDNGGQDIFIAKIPNARYINGNKIGDICSWFGSDSWSSGDAKLSKSEFEVPIGTTVIFNPIDSFIPGKKNHTWRLTYEPTDELLIDIKDAQSFIWTFNKPGFYTLYSSIEDSNGNVSVFERKGYVLVIDHKKPAPGDFVDVVNSDTFKQRTIYRRGVRHEGV